MAWPCHRCGQQGCIAQDVCNPAPLAVQTIGACGAGFRRRCLFLTTERLGAVFVFDITNPYQPTFQSLALPPQVGACLHARLLMPHWAPARVSTATPVGATYGLPGLLCLLTLGCLRASTAATPATTPALCQSDAANENTRLRAPEGIAYARWVCPACDGIATDGVCALLVQVDTPEDCHHFCSSAPRSAAPTLPPSPTHPPLAATRSTSTTRSSKCPSFWWPMRAMATSLAAWACTALALPSEAGSRFRITAARPSTAQLLGASQEPAGKKRAWLLA